MAHAPVIIVDRDESRRRTLSLLINASMRIEVTSFPTLATAFPGFCQPSARVLPQETRLFICPWDEGGEAIALERIVLGGTGPTLLLLSDKVANTRISLCHKAGNAHLIPTKPLNLNALRTRILLSLEGPMTLAARLSRSSAAFQESLAGFPALKRRLAVS